MHDPILLNPTQYWGVALVLFHIGLFYTAKQIFPFPDEAQDEL